MPRYQMSFDTNKGEKKFTVDIDDSEVLEKALPEIILELAERGFVIQGVATGELCAICNGHQLDLSRSLPEQKVGPNEGIRILVQAYTAGARPVRMDRIEHEWTLLNRLEKLNPEFVRVLGRKSRPDEESFV